MIATRRTTVFRPIKISGLYYEATLRCCVACRDPFGISRLLVPPPCLHGFREVLAFHFTSRRRGRRRYASLQPVGGRKVPPTEVKDQTHLTP